MAPKDFAYLSDKKIEKGKSKLLDEAKSWKGPSAKEKREENLDRRAMKKVVARSAEKSSLRKQMGGFILLFFMCGVGLFSFLSTVSDFMAGTGITIVDIKDTEKVKDILFGGSPWLVFCVNNQTENQRLPKVLEEDATTLYRNIGVQVATLKCWEPTSSGRSVAQRFKLRSSPPLSFAVANGNKPRVANLEGISKIEDLEKKIKPILKMDISRIGTLKQWPALCTSRRACVVIGHKNQAQRDTALNVLKPYQEKYRGLRMVTLDTAFWQLKLDDPIMQTRPVGGGKGADVLCLARPDAPEGNSTHSGSFLQQFGSSEAGSFLDACIKQTGLTRIKVTPKIKARPSKPKKVQPKPRENPPRRRLSQAPPAKKASSSKVDHVGSRASMEAEDEPLFEAVDEDEDGAASDEDGAGDEESEDQDESEEGSEQDDDGDEIEL